MEKHMGGKQVRQRGSVCAGQQEVSGANIRDDIKGVCGDGGKEGKV